MTPHLQMCANKTEISLQKWNSQLFSPPYGSPYGPRSAASSCNGSPDYLRRSPNHFSDEHMSHGICPLGGIVVLAVIIIPTRLTFFSLQQQAGHGRVISRWDLQLTFEGLAGSLTGKGLFSYKTSSELIVVTTSDSESPGYRVCISVNVIMVNCSFYWAIIPRLSVYFFQS